MNNFKIGDRVRDKRNGLTAKVIDTDHFLVNVKYNNGLVDFNVNENHLTIVEPSLDTLLVGDIVVEDVVYGNGNPKEYEVIEVGINSCLLDDGTWRLIKDLHAEYYTVKGQPAQRELTKEESKTITLDGVEYILTPKQKNMEESKCKCCEGTGVQINKDLIKVICPCCNGTGLPNGTITC